MNQFVFLTAILALSSAYSSEQLHHQWKKFKEIHKKSYNALEELKRVQIFKENIEKIIEHNILFEKKQATYKMAANQFADLTRDEFVGKILAPRSQKFAKNSKSISFSEIPEEIDWREKGAVTDVKNQGQCGSSWIFSLTGTLEGQNFVTNGQLIPLSDLELMECVQDSCNGGFIEDGFEYVRNNGLSAADAYPPADNNGTCQRDHIPAAVTVSEFVKVPSGDEKKLLNAVGTTGPVAAGVDAGTDGWQFYSSGILQDTKCSDKNLNHYILVVGYGQEKGVDFWILKNSWGSSWGEGGYVRIVRGGNNCGIATDAVYPLVEIV